MSELENERKLKDNLFKAGTESPLTPEQKIVFKGLNYYPENPALRLDLQVEEFAEKSEIEILTSKGDVRVYQRYGKFHFNVEDQPVELTLYFGKGYYFLPFVDLLAGLETYGAGRYLEPEALQDGLFRVDFNNAYNPYCAYNDNWSCPITPAENRLKVAVRAGEKIFEGH